MRSGSANIVFGSCRNNGLEPPDSSCSPGDSIAKLPDEVKLARGFDKGKQAWRIKGPDEGNLVQDTGTLGILWLV